MPQQERFPTADVAWRESTSRKHNAREKLARETLHPHAVACLGIEGKRTPGRRGRGEERDAGPAWKRKEDKGRPPQRICLNIVTALADTCA